MSEWHYRKNGKEFGPISGTALQSLAARGEILPSDLVRRGGTDKWRPAREAKGLFPTLSETSPTAAASAGQPPSSFETSGGGGLLGVVSILIGLASIVVGAAAVAAFFTPYAGFTVSLAMIALISGTFTLLFDWIRDVPRFSVSVMGVVMGTVAISMAFVHQGALDFKRYKPIVVVKEVTKPAEPDAAQREIERAKDRPRPDAPDVQSPASAVAERDPRPTQGRGSPDAPDFQPLASTTVDVPASDDAKVAAAAPKNKRTVPDADVEDDKSWISSRPSGLSAVVVSPLNLEGFPPVTRVFLMKAGVSHLMGPFQSSEKLGSSMLVPPGSYDLYFKAGGGNNEPIKVVATLKVAERRTVEIDSNRAVCAIVVKDPGTEVPIRKVMVRLAGEKFNDVQSVYDGVGKPLLIPTGQVYDVCIKPDRGQDAPVVEKVRPRGGELFVVGGTDSADGTNPDGTRKGQ